MENKMGDYKLSGDFSFDSRNITSMDEFKFQLVLTFDEMSKEQHIFMKSKISEQLGLRAWDVPTPWGDNPVRYEEMNFVTHPKDFERCKTMIKLMQEGGVELNANGYRYPPDSDHPLMAAIPECEELRSRFRDFNGLKGFLDQTWAEARQMASPASGNVSKQAPLQR